MVRSEYAIEFGQDPEAELRQRQYLRYAAPLAVSALQYEGLDIGQYPIIEAALETVKGDYVARQFQEDIERGVESLFSGKKNLRNAIYPHIPFQGTVTALDGINGCGKSTVINAIKDEDKEPISRNSNDSNLVYPLLKGKFLPDHIRLKDLSPVAESLLLAGNLYHSIGILSKPKINLLDRGPLSFFAYQDYIIQNEYHTSEDISRDFLNLLLAGISIPRKNIFLDIDMEKIEERIEVPPSEKRGYNGVITSFRKHAQQYPNTVVINANNSVSTVLNDLIGVINYE